MSQERTIRVLNGWTMLPFNLLLGLTTAAAFVNAVRLLTEAGNAGREPSGFSIALLIGSILAFVATCIMLAGHFALQPNEARVLVLFGAYVGTVRESGFHWTNPFNSKIKMSLRVRNLDSARLKVNDKRGNPIEIAAVVVWRIHDTAQAKFDVFDYLEYVRIQCESAIRHLASGYAYDHGDGEEVTLLSGVDEVSGALTRELQERLHKAGVMVDEARLSHLAYAPEIAGAMLRRQQAEAVIAARQKIVHGAVSMVEMALKDLGERQVITLDEERKAAMVSNLLVVLCSDHDATPVINAGTLYNYRRYPDDMPERKSFLLRIDPALYQSLEAWAQQELRSVNGQIEYLLKQAVARRRGEGKPAAAAPGPDETPPDES